MKMENEKFETEENSNVNQEELSSTEEINLEGSTDNEDPKGDTETEETVYSDEDHNSEETNSEDKSEVEYNQPDQETPSEKMTQPTRIKSFDEYFEN